MDEETDELVLTPEAQVEGGDQGQEAAEESWSLDEGDDETTERPDDPELVKRLRKVARDALQKAADAKRQPVQLPPQQPEPLVEVGNRPKIEDFDWDQDKFEKADDAWLARRDKRAEQERKQQAAQQAERDEVEKLNRQHLDKAAQLRVTDFPDADRRVRSVLSPNAQFAIAKYADNSARLIYALDKNPKTLQEFTSAPDIAAQIKIMGALEERMKKAVTARKAPPAPEAPTIQRGTASPSPQGDDKIAEKLRKDGERTGDMSAYFKHQRDLRKAGK